MQGGTIAMLVVIGVIFAVSAFLLYKSVSLANKQQRNESAEE